MTTFVTEPSESWIIGYGNPHRRDDGIGPYIVGRLQNRFKESGHIRFRTTHQLEPALVEELGHADRLVLVDATLKKLRDGWECARIRSESGALPYLTHHIKPSFLLALLESVYHRSPRTWLASVQGDDFGFGEGLTPEAEARAKKAMSAIFDLVGAHGIDKTDNPYTLQEDEV
jgi:hydrogenase maturation protease